MPSKYEVIAIKNAGLNIKIKFAWQKNGISIEIISIESEREYHLSEVWSIIFRYFGELWNNTYLEIQMNRVDDYRFQRTLSLQALGTLHEFDHPITTTVSIQVKKSGTLVCIDLSNSPKNKRDRHIHFEFWGAILMLLGQLASYYIIDEEFDPQEWLYSDVGLLCYNEPKSTSREDDVTFL